MADIKTQIKSAKKILEQRGCMAISCNDCPANEEHSISLCDDKFGRQKNINEFNDRAITWFKNWLKENDRQSKQGRKEVK